MDCEKVAKIVGGKIVDYVCTDKVTGEIVDCDECTKQAQIVPASDIECREIKVGYDNGVTPGSSSNDCGVRSNFIRYDWEFEVVSWEVNGQLVGVSETIGPFTGWTPQLQGWADFFNANNPNTCANAEFGFKPAPTWRYAEITDCNPRAFYGPLIMKRKDTGCIYTVYPILESSEITKLKKICAYNCETEQIETIYYDTDGNLTAPNKCPECFMPCGFNFGEYISGESPCVSTLYDTLCDELEDGTKVPFVLVITDCGATRTREVYTLDSWLNAASPDELVEYVPVGLVVDCVSCEQFEEPEPTIEDCGCESTDALLVKQCEPFEVNFPTTECQSGTAQWKTPRWSMWIGTPANDPTVTHCIIVDGGTPICATITNDGNKASMVTALTTAFINQGLGVSVIDLSPEGSQIEIQVEVPCGTSSVDFTVEGVASTQQSTVGEFVKEECESKETLSTLGCKDAEILAAIKGISFNNTHLIEGCLDGGIEAFTIVDDTGTPLFDPKPLTELGFVSCCDSGETKEETK